MRKHGGISAVDSLSKELKRQTAIHFTHLKIGLTLCVEETRKTGFPAPPAVAGISAQ